MIKRKERVSMLGLDNLVNRVKLEPREVHRMDEYEGWFVNVSIEGQKGGGHGDGYLSLFGNLLGDGYEGFNSGNGFGDGYSGARGHGRSGSTYEFREDR